MDYNNYSERDYNSPSPHGERMATIGMILAIVGLATGCCVYTGFICGALAIILALLGRGKEQKLSSRGKLAVILGAVSVASTLILCVVSVVYAIYSFGGVDGFMDYYDRVMKMYSDPSGIDYSEYSKILQEFLNNAQ